MTADYLRKGEFEQIPAEMGPFQVPVAPEVNTLTELAMSLAETAIKGGVVPEKITILPQKVEIVDVDTGEPLTQAEIISRISKDITAYRANAKGVSEESK